MNLPKINPRLYWNLGRNVSISLRPDPTNPNPSVYIHGPMGTTMTLNSRQLKKFIRNLTKDSK